MSDLDPNDRRAEAARWLDHAVEDIEAIDVCLAAGHPLPGIVAYHCQQAAEKMVKGLLTVAAAQFPFTHSLKVLGDIAVIHYPHLREVLFRLEPVTAWNTGFQYPAPRRQGSPVRRPTPDEIQTSLEDVLELATVLRALMTPT